MTRREWLYEFSIRLQNMMIYCKMDRQQLSDASGVSESCLCRYLNGTMSPNIYNLINLADALYCTVSDLVDFGDIIEK